MICFSLFFMRLIKFHDPSHGFSELTQIDFVIFLFFLNYFFISSFNIELIDGYVFIIYFDFFLSDHHNFINQVVNLIG